MRQSGRAGSRSEWTDTSGTYVSQWSSRRTVHHSTHVMMTQLRLEMSQRMRVTLKAWVNHGRRKSGADPMNFAHIVTDVRVQTVLHTAGGRVVVFPLAVIVTRGLCSCRRRLRRLRRCLRCLAVCVLPAHVLRIWQLVVFLPFHTAVLKPDFDLSLRQDQVMSNLDSSSSRQIPIEVEFLFQFEYLVPRVGSSLSLWLHSRCVRAVRDARNMNLFHPWVNSAFSVLLVLLFFLHYTRRTLHLTVFYVIWIRAILHMMLLLLLLLWGLLLATLYVLRLLRQ